MTTFKKHTILFAAALAAVGCGGTQLVGSRYIKTQQVTASQGAVISVSSEEDTVLAGMRLTIPAGALAQDTTLSVDRAPQDLATDGTRSSAVAEWGPSGLLFATSATMVMPVAVPEPLDDAEYVAFIEEADGTQLEVPATLDAASRTVSFPVGGFSKFQVKRLPNCRVNADCAAGKVCRSGHCRTPLQGGCNCQQGYTCQNATCVLKTSCVADADCAVGSACVMGTCSAAHQCNTNADCNAMLGQVCQANTCVTQHPPQCQTDSDCGVQGQICAMGACVAKPDAGPGRCNSNADCNTLAGEFCQMNICVHAFPPPADGGTKTDGGMGGQDGGVIKTDGGTGGQDGGVIKTDGGMGGQDGGVIKTDGGSGGQDGGVVKTDGGSGGADGGFTCQSTQDCAQFGLTCVMGRCQ
ncbi:MAG: hypothetical protein K1X89_30340 [Myxococcaceae bacterium]|nr:hypothetical protein [Myxococcaceae bacterium]